MQLTSEDYQSICKLIDERSGIVLDETKGYLVESRLKRIAEQFGCSTYSELAHKVRYSADPTLSNAFIDAITTRETLFFRDNSPFQALEHKAIPEIIDSKATTPFPRRLRIWSAACSSGQEPYSIAITLINTIPDVHSWDVSILATDLSNAAIAQASLGIFSKFEIERGLDERTRSRFFSEHPKGWKISDEVRSLVSFQERNLLEPFGHLGVFDVIMCRNVAIYFDLATKRDLFERLSQVLSKTGYLFVGSSESLSGFGSRWKPQDHCRSVYYRPNLPASAQMSLV